MNLKTLPITAIFIITSCKSQSASPVVAPTPLPTEASAATATLASTETPLLTETLTALPASSDVFGAIPLNSVQAFSIEPIAKAIFDQTLQGYVTAGTFQEFRVDSVAVFPSGDGGLIAEITYSLRTDHDLWPEDFGIPDAHGWINGKCSRFDLVATESEHQLRNKRLCS
jgi:hypothetical protein